MTETEVERGCKRFLLRSAPRLAASLDLRAAGITPIAAIDPDRALDPAL